MRHLRIAFALASLALTACGKPPHIALQYQLMGLMPNEVVRVETRIAVADGDPRVFTADEPYRSVAAGIGYEVRDFDNNGVRTVLVTHDSTLGYEFDDAFTFTLLPPVGDAPVLTIRARALGVANGDVLADSGPQGGAFGKSAETQLPLVDQRCGTASTCTGNTACCDTSCVDVAASVTACGACGQACGASGDACSGGQCRCNGGAGCGTDQACCAGLGCVRNSNDIANCGGCGRACQPGETCADSACACGNTQCAVGQNCCDGTCTDGPCTCNGTQCDVASPICCDGRTCTDLSSDDKSCGTCDHVCADPLHCSDGQCQCNGTGVCGTSDTCCDSGCKNLDTDPKNCGGCDKACSLGETCMGGQCRCGGSGGCSSDKICCIDTTGGRCADPTSDRDNCGGCGIVCASDEACAQSHCTCPGVGASCNAGQTCCPDACADLSSNHDHCGSCGKVCGTDEDCQGGQCITVTHPCIPSCAADEKCISGKCFCGNAQVNCNLANQACCDDGCVDTTQNGNCGGCGILCGFGQVCCNKMCVFLLEGLLCGAID